MLVQSLGWKDTLEEEMTTHSSILAGVIPWDWCFWTVVLEKTLESPLDCKEIKSVNLKGNQPWIVIGRTDAEALISWPPDAKNRLTGKDPDAGQDWRQEKKETTEDEMAGWHDGLDGPESEWTPGNWWWTGRPGVLQFMGSQTVRHDWATELNWTESHCGQWLQPWN